MIEHRVKFVGRLSDQEMIDHFARCRAVVFPPFNEDYGFVTVEAFMCGKPVITCRDSGGPSELVRDGENGYVTDPTPEALAVGDAQADRRSQPRAAPRRSRSRDGHADDVVKGDSAATALDLRRGASAEVLPDARALHSNPISRNG